jgi:hypothetical protein
MKRQYLVVHDYGTGGLWAIIIARSAAEIGKKYPSLTIVDERTGWMNEEIFADIALHNLLDIDDAPTGWLAKIGSPPDPSRKAEKFHSRTTES